MWTSNIRLSSDMDNSYAISHHHHIQTHNNNDNNNDIHLTNKRAHQPCLLLLLHAASFSCCILCILCVCFFVQLVYFRWLLSLSTMLILKDTLETKLVIFNRNEETHILTYQVQCYHENIIMGNVTRSQLLLRCISMCSWAWSCAFSWTVSILFRDYVVLIY